LAGVADTRGTDTNMVIDAQQSAVVNGRERLNQEQDDGDRQETPHGSSLSADRGPTREASFGGSIGGEF
jgi:hypothetical protein